MYQADLEIAFRSSLLALMEDNRIPVLQHYDYIKKGKRDKAIYFTIQNPTKIGNSYRDYSTHKHIEKQHFQANIQITIIDKDDVLDLANYINLLVGSLSFMELMRDKKIGIQNVSGIRTVSVTDENDNYALECHFDFNITFNRDIELTTSFTQSAELNTVLH